MTSASAPPMMGTEKQPSWTVVQFSLASASGLTAVGRPAVEEGIIMIPLGY